MPPSQLVLHGLAPSHPCMTAEAALRHKGLEYERIDFQPGPHMEEMQKIYGEGNATVPGMLVDGEPVHGSRPILAKLEELAPDPPLYPEPIADAVAEAERWGDEELQDLGRRAAVGRAALPARGDGHLRRRRRPRPAGHGLRDQARSAAPGSTTGSRPSGWPPTWPGCPPSSTTWTRWPRSGVIGRRRAQRRGPPDRRHPAGAAHGRRRAPADRGPARRGDRPALVPRLPRRDSRRGVPRRLGPARA